MADKKYYWLKLKRDFFKRHDIQIIEDMENGKDYILFYLKLLCESVDHEGHLRFSETIPYNEKMLSTITNTNIDIVRSAMKVFSELNMIEILDDDTIFMTECNKMLGCETYWAEQKRKQREKQDKIGQCPKNVQALSNMSKQEKDIELDKDIKKEIKKKKFEKPTLEEVSAYCKERNNGIDAEAFIAFYESKGWLIGKTPMKSWKSAIITWEKSRTKQYSYKENPKQDYLHHNYTKEQLNSIIDDLDNIEI